MDLISQYDKTYADDPDKWVSLERNEFAWLTTRKYGTPRTLLDIGCGSGHTIRYLKWRYYLTQFTGIDLSGEAIRLANARIPGERFIQTSLEDWDTDETFDQIFLMGVIEHFPDLPKALAKIQQLKSKLGVVYIETPNTYAFTGENEEGRYVVDLKGEEQPEWHYSRESWERILRDAGFTILEQLSGPFWYCEFVWVVQ